MTYQLTTLDSGLRVASETLPGMESVAVTVTCGIGARYEDASDNGISHLLEHMAFKGTRTRSARDIAEAFDNIGGKLNAYTSMELTVYYAKVLKQDVRLAVDILGDILKHSTFTPEELAREQDVIIQELAMHRDTPEDLLVDYFDEVMFPDQPLGRSILGNETRIAAFTRADLIRYMDTHYKPPRMVLSAAGNIDHDTLVTLARKYFDLPKAAAGKPFSKAAYVGGDARVTSDLEQLHLALGLPAVPIHSPQFYALQVYANILGGGMSSRLFQEVREKRGLAYSVYAMGTAYDDVGTLNIYAATSPEKGGELSLVLCEELAAMTKIVSDTELSRAKNQLIAELLMAREESQTIAAWIGRHLLTYGRYRPVEEIIGKIQTVTAADIAALAREMLTGKLTVAALGDVRHIRPYEVLQQALR